MNREGIKIAGIYILGILLILRLAVVPLYGSVKAKKALLNEYKETYRMKVLALQRYKSEKKAVDIKPVDKETALKAVYPKDEAYPSIQSDFLSKIIGAAEKNGMTVMNFELPDISPSKNISEVPVIIRLKGTPGAFNALLKDMDGWDKKMRFRQFEVSKSGQDNVFTLLVSIFRIER